MSLTGTEPLGSIPSTMGWGMEEVKKKKRMDQGCGSTDQEGGLRVGGTCYVNTPTFSQLRPHLGLLEKGTPNPR